MRHEESRLQINCVKVFRLRYPHFANLLFSVPNGGARRPVEASIMKAEGMTAGVSDLILLVPNVRYHGMCIEMKTRTGKQSDAQKEWQKAVTALGYKYAIIRSLDEFISIIDKYFVLT